MRFLFEEIGDDLRRFSAHWSCIEAVLAMYFSKNTTKAEKRAALVRSLFFDLKISYSDLDSTEIATAKNAVAAVRSQILDGKIGVSVLNSELPIIKRSEFKLHAVLWTSWALRRSKLPLHPDFVKDLSAWLLEEKTKKLRFLYMKKESDQAGQSEKIIWRGKRRSLVAESFDLGYTVQELLVPGPKTYRASSSGERIGKSSYVFAASKGQYQRKWIGRLPKQKRFLAASTEDKLLKAVKAIDREQSMPILTGRNEAGLLQSNIGKAKFIELLKLKFPEYEEVGKEQLIRGIQSVVAFKRGRPKK